MFYKSSNHCYFQTLYVKGNGLSSDKVKCYIKNDDGNDDRDNELKQKYDAFLGNKCIRSDNNDDKEYKGTVANVYQCEDICQ